MTTTISGVTGLRTYLLVKVIKVVFSFVVTMISWRDCATNKRTVQCIELATGNFTTAFKLGFCRNKLLSNKIRSLPIN